MELLQEQILGNQPGADMVANRHVENLEVQVQQLQQQLDQCVPPWRRQQQAMPLQHGLLSVRPQLPQHMQGLGISGGHPMAPMPQTGQLHQMTQQPMQPQGQVPVPYTHPTLPTNLPL